MSQETETKTAYISETEAKIEELNAQINQMLAKTNQAKAEMAVQYHEQMDDLCRKRDDAKTRLQALKASSEDAWAELREGLEGAWKELSQAFDRAIKHFQ